MWHQIFLPNYVLIRLIHIPQIHINNVWKLLRNPHFFIVDRASINTQRTKHLQCTKQHLTKDVIKLTHDFIFWQTFTLVFFFLFFFSLLQHPYLSCPQGTLIEETWPWMFCTSKWRPGPIDYFGLTDDTNVSYPFYLCAWSPNALCHCTNCI